jgi:hypothetical protein
VENRGTIDATTAGWCSGAGDLYSLAVRNSGTVRASGGNVTVSAADGAVQNSGRSTRA